MKAVIKKLTKKLSLVGISAILAGGLVSGAAEAQQFHSTFKNWEVYSTKENGQKVCFITSYPVSKQGNYRKRSEPYALVTYRSGGQSEVSFYVGYPFKANYEADVSVDGRHNFKFFTTPKTPGMAWAKNAQDDANLITRMRNGGGVSAKGTSQRGTYSTDKYSLNGFTAAYNKIKELCR